MTSPPHEVTIGSRVDFAGALLKVRVDDVRMPSGRISVREVVEHAGAVAVIALTADGFLLLVRQFRHAINRETLELPAGVREPDESPVETARRELLEETGQTPGSLREITSFFPTPGYSAEEIILFHATGCVPVGVDTDAEEPAKLVKIPVSDIPQLLVDPDRIIDGKTLIGLLWLMNQDRIESQL